MYYRPPGSDNIYLDELAKCLSFIESSGNDLDILLLGDFKLPNICWSTPTCSPQGPDGISSLLCDIVQDYFLHQLISKLTRGDNILDLVLASAPELVSYVKICERFGNSDHDSIELRVKLKSTKPKIGARIWFMTIVEPIGLDLKKISLKSHGIVFISRMISTKFGNHGKRCFSKQLSVIIYSIQYASKHKADMLNFLFS